LAPVFAGFMLTDSMAQTVAPQSQQQQQTMQVLLDEINQLKARVEQLEQQVGKSNPAALVPVPGSVPLPPEVNAPLGTGTLIADKLAEGELQIGHTNISIRGWLEGAMTWRAHNEFAAASNTNFGTPFPNSTAYDDQELQADARNTRITINTTSNVLDNTQLTGRLEFDWQNVASDTTQNNNSWGPRLRHAFMEADSLDTGWHLMVGQSYSLTTPYGNLVLSDGSPSTDEAWTLRPNLPIVNLDPLDDLGPAGVNAPRQMQIRVIKDLSSNAAIALSLENPLVVWGANLTGTAPVYTGTTLVPGSNSQFNNNGSQSLSLGSIPDVILKVGYDPIPNYHFEGFGIVRNYKDMAGTSGLTGTGRTTADGAAFDTYIKAVPGKLDLTGGVGYGSLGGYTGSGIADVSFTATGKPVAIKEAQAWGGVIGHPNHNLDLFTYAGMERAQAAAVDGIDYGYGNPHFLNGGCNVLSGTCTGSTKLVWDAELGAIWRFYNGGYGHMDFLPQITYLRRMLFADINGDGPATSNLAVDLAFRYYPF